MNKGSDPAGSLPLPRSNRSTAQRMGVFMDWLTMDWLILVLVTPLIVVTLVLLRGFAGCKFDPQIVTTPLAPQSLVATPISVSEISLTWDNPETRPVRFEIQRAKDGAPFEVLATVDNPPFVDPTNLQPPAPLDPGITFNYQVFAIDASDQGNRSQGSNVASARPLALAADLSVTQQVAPANYCFVLRIGTARLRNNGTKVRITVQGSPSGNVVINSIYISRVAPSGDPYDSLGAPNPGGLTQIASAVALTDGQPKTLGLVDYVLDQAQDLIIAFDFTATAAQGNIRYDPAPGVTLYFKPGAQEAGMADRSAGYLLQADPRFYLVKQIEVL
jgi:hypothetical protein